MENLVYPIAQNVSGNIGGVQFNSMAEMECLKDSINSGFNFAAQKYALWIDLLFIAVVICSAAKALQGLQHKYPQIERINKRFTLFGENLTVLSFIESTAYEFLAAMSLTLFALQFLNVF